MGQESVLDALKRKQDWCCAKDIAEILPEDEKVCLNGVMRSLKRLKKSGIVISEKRRLGNYNRSFYKVVQ